LGILHGILLENGLLVTAKGPRNEFAAKPDARMKLSCRASHVNAFRGKEGRVFCSSIGMDEENAMQARHEKQVLSGVVLGIVKGKEEY
jgi:hypothetical protein